MADANSFRLERKPGVRERIDYLARQAQDRTAEKRVALEEQLWAVLEADMGAFWETYETAKTSKDGELETDQEGKMLTVRKQRAKLINDLPPEFRKLIEDLFYVLHFTAVKKSRQRDTFALSETARLYLSPAAAGPTAQRVGGHVGG